MLAPHHGATFVTTNTMNVQMIASVTVTKTPKMSEEVSPSTMASEKQIKYMYALEKKLGRKPKWREGVTSAYAQSLIEELLGEVKGIQP